MTKDKIKQLLDKYAKGTCTLEERQLLELWFEQQGIEDQYTLSAPDKIRLWQQIEAKTENTSIRSPFRPRYYRWAAAAAMVITLAVSTYLIYQRQNTLELLAESASTAILPGENKAVLTLSDGRQIALTNNTTETTKDQGISITKTVDGQLQYRIDPTIAAGKGFNTITTPRGGQYEIILPDGSKVTLNAESSLRFAVDMHRQKKRIVELKGEGYFEVAKDTKHPFVVNSNQQEIQVLGTVFNVNSYRTDRSQTTLLEGSVLVNQKQKLRPGQQALVEGKVLHVKDVDVNDFVDWKNNAFIFRNERLESIMERVGRWYNVDYTFEHVEAKNIMFNGEISRYANVDDVLTLLKRTSKVKFDIQGRSITIR